MAAALLALRLALSFSVVVSEVLFLYFIFFPFLFSLKFCQLLGSSFADASLTARSADS